MLYGNNENQDILLNHFLCLLWACHRLLFLEVISNKKMILQNILIYTKNVPNTKVSSVPWTDGFRAG